MLAFAGNSLLCRMALDQELIDAATFTSLRTLSGALVLFALVLPRWRERGRAAGDWRSTTMLFIYLACFSFAYLSLGAGTGALILFGAVQLTMITAALRAGEKFSTWSWLGLLIAICGLIWLVLPGINAPSPSGAALMAIAGMAWGIYSLRGSGAADPLEATANNFIYAIPFALVLMAIFVKQAHATTEGVVLALLSGALTSGIGYVIWYAALEGLTATRAATVQLTVPAIAAFGGVLWLTEALTLRLILSTFATLFGVWIVLNQRTTLR